MNPLRALLICATISIALATPQGHVGTSRTIDEMMLRAERWPVKVGGDGDVMEVNLADAMPTTIESLRNTPRPIANKKYLGAFEKGIHEIRVDVVEKTLFKVDCLIMGAMWEKGKKDGDSDFHIVIADPQSHATMIAEIPDPRYVPSTSPFRALIVQVRQTFQQLAGTLPGKFRPFQPPIRANVTGVGFWDFTHGQTGVAPNAVEIHPVLGIDVDQ